MINLFFQQNSVKKVGLIQKDGLTQTQTTQTVVDRQKTGVTDQTVRYEWVTNESPVRYSIPGVQTVQTVQKDWNRQRRGNH